MYTSFHFCSVVRPIVLWMQGASFLNTSWWVQGEWRPLTLSGLSCTEVSSVSHLVLNWNMSFWKIHLGRQNRDLGLLHMERQFCLEVTLCLGPRVQQVGNTSRWSMSEDSPHPHLGLPTLPGMFACPSLFLWWDFRFLVKSPQSSLVLGRNRAGRLEKQQRCWVAFLSLRISKYTYITPQ